ncbi:hypothetical protein E6C27_scaffold238G00430 [Cucumis melo var. makuwa]|uniref:Uncharacterized protein n=1 Tax=Cucumis melo var. makuwa TaxID=1194695 RepID=A0A5A7VLK1_CUCMM|nr:hypothetical protein E6C27_scaffold238G00430 [Cucumis melo var. makuwa]
MARYGHFWSLAASLPLPLPLPEKYKWKEVLKVVPKNWHVPEHVQHVIPEEHKWSLVIPKERLGQSGGDPEGYPCRNSSRTAEAGGSRCTAQLRHARFTWRLAQARVKARVGFRFAEKGRESGFGCTSTYTRSTVSERVGYATMNDRRRSVDGAIVRRTTALRGWSARATRLGLQRQLMESSNEWMRSTPGTEDGMVHGWLRLGCVRRLADRDDGAAIRVAGRGGRR